MTTAIIAFAILFTMAVVAAVHAYNTNENQ
jgi:hypothetical protein